MLVLPFRSANKTILFDPTYAVGVRFINSGDRINYMTELDNRYLPTPSTASAYYQEINFDHNNVLYSTVRWVIDSSTDFNDYLHSNYLHAYDVERNIHYFYFITNVKILREDVLEYTLELDVLTTYLNEISFDRPLFVEKHHCNRFTTEHASSSRVNFNFDEALLGDELDQTFNAQVINESSFAIRQPDYFTHTNLNTTINNQLWMYVWLLPTTSNKATTKIRMNPTQIDTSIDTGLQCYVAPIGNGQLINTYIVPTIYQWNARYLYDYVMRDTTINARLVSVKISPYAPFNKYSGYQSASPQFIFKPAASNTRLDIEFEDTDSTTDYVFGNGNQYTITGSGTGSNWLPTLTPAYRFLAVNWLSSTHSATAQHFLSTGYIDTIPNNFGKPNTFDNKNPIFEPKLYIAPYYQFTYHHKGEQPKKLNPAFIKTGRISIDVIDSPLAHEHKTTTLIKPLFTSDYKRALETNRAATEINAYELLTSSDAYAEYITRHSNHLVTGIVQPVFQQLGMGLAMTGITGNPMPILSAGMSAGATAFSHMKKLDDLKATPDTIKNTGNNLIHDINQERSAIGLRTYVEELTSHEKQQVHEYYYKYGYRVNKFKTWGNQTTVGDDKIFTRTKFNYVKTNDEEIASNIKSAVPMSRIIKQKIQDILNNGIRLITSSSVASITNDYAKLEKENVEIIL